MNPKVLKQVTALIHKRYPEFAGIQPKVKAQKATQPKSLPAEPTYVLTFKRLDKISTIANPKTISRLMRVVVNARGKIIKVTTSR